MGKGEILSRSHEHPSVQHWRHLNSLQTNQFSKKSGGVSCLCYCSLRYLNEINPKPLSVRADNVSCYSLAVPSLAQGSPPMKIILFKSSNLMGVAEIYILLPGQESLS